jgi:ribonuclease Z
MIPFRLNILGSGSALPTLHRNPTSQLLQYNGCYLLIDCAEGTQLQLKKIKISPMRIAHVLISHLHGDHYFGLIGLITSLHLMGRTTTLHLYGPPQLYDIIQMQLDASQTKLGYPITFAALETDGQNLILEYMGFNVFSFPVVHRIPTWGFLIAEKSGERRIKKDFISQYSPDIEKCKAIKAGANYILADGREIANELITHEPAPPRSYAYCTDTAYNDAIIPIIKDVSLLYHEATFMHHMAKEAARTGHSTTVEAATIAKKANVGKLVLGHYSSRYKNLTPLLEEAIPVFANTIAGDDGLQIDIG